MDAQQKSEEEAKKLEEPIREIQLSDLQISTQIKIHDFRKDQSILPTKYSILKTEEDSYSLKKTDLFIPEENLSNEEPRIMNKLNQSSSKELLINVTNLSSGTNIHKDRAAISDEYNQERFDTEEEDVDQLPGKL